LRPGTALLHAGGMPVIRTGRCARPVVLIACCALLAASCLPCSAAPAHEIAIEIAREGEFVSVRASAELKASPHIAWEVLTDYDHLAEFIPDLRSSRVVQRGPEGVLVEQKGEFGFLFFRQSIEVTMAVSEQPPRRILARAVAGDMKDMQGSYELQASEAGLRLVYSGRFVPGFFVPPLIGMPLVRRSLERRFRAMVEEIERRDALARIEPKP
jgi:carbon monoxide dehydrogenase subunit G